MKYLKLTCLALSLCLMASNATIAAPVQSLTDKQAEEVKKIVRELLQKEPKIIIDSLKAYQVEEEERAMSQSSKAVKEHKKDLENDPTSPVAGNPKGDVTIVEFFDYNCGYCKMAVDNITKIIKEDKNVRVVFKELPIFGETSNTITKAALASQKQGKYLEFHIALMKSKKRVNDTTMMDIAKEVGLDIAKLEKDMKAPEIDKIIEKNQALASKIGVRGTPGFIIGDKLFPGAVPYEKIKETIAKVRKGS